jgi:hypothetical protein
MMAVGDHSYSMDAMDTRVKVRATPTAATPTTAPHQASLITEPTKPAVMARPIHDGGLPMSRHASRHHRALRRAGVVVATNAEEVNTKSRPFVVSGYTSTEFSGAGMVQFQKLGHSLKARPVTQS